MAQTESTLKGTFNCPKCGCLTLPDATKCPKCNNAYDSTEIEGVVGSNQNSLKPKTEKADIQIITAHYQFICPRHGKIRIRVITALANIKCPFC